MRPARAPVPALPWRAALAALTALVGAGCALGDDGPPEVTFAAAGSTVVARPTQLCDVKVENCTADVNAAVVLRVPPGQPLDISVPESVAETPWIVVFGYRTTAGERVNGRTELFASNEREAYTLTLPAPEDQLETVEVQQISATFVPTQEGVDFPTRATWVLSVDDR